MRIGISFSFFEFSQIYNISGIATCKIDSAGIGSVLEFSGSGFYSFGRFFGNCFPMIHYFRYSGYGYLRFLRYIPENRELDMEVILDCKNLKCMVNEITR